MGEDAPLTILKYTVWAYWASVVALVVYKALRFGLSSGVVPRQSWERWLWIGMVPVVLAWLVLPVLAENNPHRPSLAVPNWAISSEWATVVRCIAAVLAVACYMTTAYCWLLMGRNWSIAVVPEQQTELVTRGLYALVRHPIYSLSVFLMLLSALVLPTWPMLLVAISHIGLLNIKAAIEERHLVQLHGDSYVHYCQRVGRFWPRLVRASRG